MLRSQHGPAIVPIADRRLVRAVGRALETAAPGEGESYTTPEHGDDRFVALVAARARRFPVRGLVRAKGARSRECHKVTAELVRSDPTRYAHVFGYALDRDTHWRTHSWAWDRERGRIVEPTPITRRVYVGAELTDAEAADFADWSLG